MVYACVLSNSSVLFSYEKEALEAFFDDHEIKNKELIAPVERIPDFDNGVTMQQEQVDAAKRTIAIGDLKLRFHIWDRTCLEFELTRSIGESDGFVSVLSGLSTIIMNKDQASQILVNLSANDRFKSEEIEFLDKHGESVKDFYKKAWKELGVKTYEA